MTEIISNETTRRRPGVNKLRKHSVKTDMTPMVDLGFILVSFFVLTVRLSEPVAVNLNMPKDGHSTPIKESASLTILLDKDDRAYYYHGEWQKAVDQNAVLATNYSSKEGIGKLIRDKQQRLTTSGHKDGRDGLSLVIKAGERSSYKNVIDALDEATINAVKIYYLVSTTYEESEWLKKRPQ